MKQPQQATTVSSPAAAGSSPQAPVFHVGDLVVYETTGVCRIQAMGPLDFSKGKRYYTLLPVFGSETIYVPMDSGAFLRPAMGRQEAEALIAQIPSIHEDTVSIRNLQLLSDYYQSAFHSHDCADLVHLIKTIYAKSTKAQQAGRKPSSFDQRYRKRAEELLHGELAVALGISREDVGEYIRQKLEGPPPEAPAE